MAKAEFAERIGVSRASVYNWLAQETYPDALSIRRIHDLTQIPLEDLVPKITA
jgi:transcriptional regulator with XRE-family HTH domain